MKNIIELLFGETVKRVVIKPFGRIDIIDIYDKHYAFNKDGTPIHEAQGVDDFDSNDDGWYAVRREVVFVSETKGEENTTKLKWYAFREDGSPIENAQCVDVLKMLPYGRYWVENYDRKNCAFEKDGTAIENSVDANDFKSFPDGRYCTSTLYKWFAFAKDGQPIENAQGVNGFDSFPDGRYCINVREMTYSIREKRRCLKDDWSAFEENGTKFIFSSLGFKNLKGGRYCYLTHYEWRLCEKDGTAIKKLPQDTKFFPNGDYAVKYNEKWFAFDEKDQPIYRAQDVDDYGSCSCTYYIKLNGKCSFFNKRNYGVISEAQGVDAYLSTGPANIVSNDGKRFFLPSSREKRQECIAIFKEVVADTRDRYEDITPWQFEYAKEYLSLLKQSTSHRADLILANFS